VSELERIEDVMRAHLDCVQEYAYEAGFKFGCGFTTPNRTYDDATAAHLADAIRAHLAEAAGNRDVRWEAEMAVARHGDGAWKDMADAAVGAYLQAIGDEK